MEKSLKWHTKRVRIVLAILAAMCVNVISTLLIAVACLASFNKKEREREREKCIKTTESNERKTY